MVAAAPSAGRVVQAPSAMMAVPAAKPKLRPVVQATISEEEAAPVVKVMCRRQYHPRCDATPISMDDLQPGLRVLRIGAWMQVTLDNDSLIFWAAFTDPSLSLRKSNQAFNSSLSSTWNYIPKLGDFNIMIDGLRTQLTEGQGRWFTGTLAWIKRHK